MNPIGNSTDESNLMSKYFTTNIYEIKDKKNLSLKQSIINDINNNERIIFSPQFQNKFFHADGYKFQPFCFELNIDLNNEEF